ncbi:MAG TPA: hypothetical protein PKA49_10690, partial [Tepidiformaceae bacterium]|nr:hypothetical protein [Tepidiformaceae bacterium]
MTRALDLAVLGGSGFYEMPGLSDVEEVAVDTPFGQPGGHILGGGLGGARGGFLARHRRGGSILPSEL